MLRQMFDTFVFLFFGTLATFAAYKAIECFVAGR